MDIKAFGLTVDNTGAVKAIREVGKSASDMARDGAKSAQLYADAFKDRLNEVARRYIPETMRAIDALREKQRTLTTSVGGASGLLSSAEIQRSAAAFDRMIAAQKGVAAASAPAFTGMNRLRESVTSMAASMLGAAPGVTQFTSILGSMAIGSGVMIGVMAGLAALSYAWNAITKEAREATKAQDEAIKKLDEANRKSRLGAGGETRAQIEEARKRLAMAEAARDALQQQALTERTTGQGIVNPATVAAMGQRTKEIAALQEMIVVGERRAAEAVAEAGRAMVDRTVSDLAKLITAHNATAAEIGNAEALVRGFTASLNALAGDGSKNAERARLIEQIRELNDALHPKKEASDAARRAEREAAEAQRIADQQANAQNQLVIDEIKRRQAERKRIEKEQDEAAKQMAADLARDQQQRAHETERIVRSSFTSLFTDILTNGKGAFQSLFDAIKAGFIKLAADMVAVNIVGRLARAGILSALFPAAAGAQGGSNYLGGLGRQMAGQAAMGAGTGALVGFGIGGMTTNRGLGAAGGAAAGALAGSAFGPLGTAAGALTGFIGGIIGSGNAAREAAKQMQALRESIALSIEGIKATLAGDSVGVAVAALKAQFAELRRAVEEANPASHLADTYRAGPGAANLEVLKMLMAQDALLNAARQKALDEVNDLEAKRIAQLKEEGKAARDTAAAMLNLTTGYKVQTRIFQAIDAGGSSRPTGSTFTPRPARPTPTGPMSFPPMQMIVNGRVLGEVVIKEFGGRSSGNPATGFIDLVSKVTA